MAPNKPQVVSFNALTVRSGSALPSLHQNSQPMSQGTYSASSFSRSNTSRAASMTSCPTPSPGIHAILYLDIQLRPYRRARKPASSAAVAAVYLSRRSDTKADHRRFFHPEERMLLACWRRHPRRRGLVLDESCDAAVVIGA